MTDRSVIILATLALLWTVNIFVYAQADRTAENMEEKVRFSISIGSDGFVIPERYQFNQQLSVTQILQLKKVYEPEHGWAMIINKFEKYYIIIEGVKLFLVLYFIYLGYVTARDRAGSGPIWKREKFEFNLNFAFIPLILIYILVWSIEHIVDFTTVIP